MTEDDARKRYDTAGMVTPWADLPINQRRMIGVIFDKSDRQRAAEKLMKMAAARSVETCLGWAHPDCETLEDAARLLQGEPVARPSTDGVLS